MSNLRSLTSCCVKSRKNVKMKFALYDEDNDPMKSSLIPTRHAHLHQSIWHFRFRLIHVHRACTPKLVKFCPPGFVVHIFGIFGIPYRSGIFYHSLHISAKIYDDWINKSWFTDLFSLLLSLPHSKFNLLIVAIFFDWFCSFVKEICTITPIMLCTNFSVDTIQIPQGFFFLSVIVQSWPAA